MLIFWYNEQSINSFSCPRQASCHEIYHRTLPHDERAGSPIFDVQRSLRENSVWLCDWRPAILKYWIINQAYCIP